MVKKHLIAAFLNTAVGTDGLVDKSAPEWTRIKKSTQLSLAMNPETETLDYISDENPTTELIRYNPNFDTPLKMYKGEPDYEFVFDKYFNQKVGDEAKSQILMVYYQEPLDTITESNTEHKVFKAQLADSTIVVNTLNINDSELDFNTNFGGTTKKGYVTITGGEPVFTEGKYSA